MRIVRLVFTLLVSLSMAAAALTYMEHEARQEWSYVQGRSTASPDQNSNYAADSTHPDTVRIATGNTDPYLQRYYSESEGWTYYTLPSYSSGRRSDRE